MNDAGQRTVNAFDSAKWRAELETLNPWMENHKPESDGFAAARRRAGIKRYSQGRETWNVWAHAMDASREKLEAAGKWTLAKKKFDRPIPSNPETKLWLASTRADFHDHKFNDHADLSNFVFPGAADFDEAHFSAEANFNGTQFLGETGFANTQFDGNAWFSGTQFSGGAWFRNAKFLGGAGFNKAQFSHNAEFLKAQFSGVVWFDRAAFFGDAEFGEAQFSDNAWFDRAQFILNAGFANVAFSRDARFDSANFSGVAWFSEALFSGIAWFERAKFFSDAHFDKVRFSGDAGFKWAEFMGSADFSRTLFRRPTEFAAARFDGMSNFSTLRVEQTFSLENARFERVPNFIQARFAEAPRLDSLSLARNVEPGGFLRSTLRVFWPNVGRARHLSARYRALKLIAIQSQDRAREQIFFKGELRSRRGGSDLLFSWRLWFGVAYELLSDFGYSFVRPIGWWATTTAAFCFYNLGKHFDAHNPGYPVGAAIWLWTAFKAWTVDLFPFLAKFEFGLDIAAPPSLSCIAGNGAPFVSALLLAIKKGVLFLGIVPAEKINQAYACLYGLDESYSAARRGSDLIPVVPDAVAIAGIVQALLSAILIFLFLMVMRNHFRIRQ